MHLHDMRALYLEELQDLYDAEHQITEALPKMIQACHHPDLKSAFETHLQETRGQIGRLEQVFQMLGEKAERKTCTGMKGIIAEGSDKLKHAKDSNPDVLDAGLIAAAQHVEHYEMAGYGCVRTWARELGFHDQARLLQQTLDEEGNTDKLLTSLAEERINRDAEEGEMQTTRSGRMASAA